MKNNIYKNIAVVFAICLLLSNIFIIMPSEKVNAGSYNGQDLALAILANASWLVSSSYTDTDEYGHRQAAVLSSKGTLHPTHGNSFALLSTGIAGTNIITTYAASPGDERGTWFDGGMKSYPRDESTLTMTLQVPPFMHYLYYDVQFLSAEYPEYVGTQYNDKLTITVNSPSKGSSHYIFDVNSGYFVLNSNGITGTGFDIFARSGTPDGVDMVDRTPRAGKADAGASDLIPIGGMAHPVSPNEQITVTIDIKDAGDNLFDSGAFIDNLMFSGWAKTEIVARKTYEDLNGAVIECGDTIKYTVTISNTGEANQNNNPGNEFEDFIPEHTTYVDGSITATSGTINYNAVDKKITWNGGIPAESAVSLTFQVIIDQDLENSTIISNQGSVFWDSNEDGTNYATELTDNPFIDDGIDQDHDGDTNDDDPTNFTVLIIEPPSSLTEDFDFPDDHAGGKASQSDDYGHKWFETSERSSDSIFEVACCYYYSSTNQSFKTKLRSSGSPQYWYYNLSELQSDLEWWEVWFACGDASEEYNLYLNFENSNQQDIAKIKFEYVHEGNNSPIDWVLECYYWDPSSGWMQLYSDYVGGYLRNDWYKLRIEKNGANYINYSLFRSDTGLVDSAISNQLTASFSDFSRVKWSSDKNPVVCPMFFWDDHTIGLT